MRRTRTAWTCAAAAAIALIAYYLVAWAQVTPTRERGTDFSASYVAATLLRSGEGARLYDQRLEASAHQAILPADARVDLPFITPPTSAVLALPFTALDPGAAFRLWSLLQLALLLAAIVVAGRSAPWPETIRAGPRVAVALVALAGAGTFAFLLLGQLDGFSALGLAAAYGSWRSGRPGRAGFWLAFGSAVAKPHLALGLAVWMVARRERRALAGSTLGLAVLVTASLVAVGPGGLAGFLGALRLSYGHTPPASTLGLAGLAASWLGDTALAAFAATALALAGLAACAALGARSRSRPAAVETSLAAATAVSLLVSPHLLPHDLVVLAPAFVWASARAATADLVAVWPGRLSLQALLAWIGLDLLAVLDTGNASHAPPGRVVPWALAAAGVAALRIRPPAAEAVAGDPASSRRNPVRSFVPAAPPRRGLRVSPRSPRRRAGAREASGRDAR